MMKVLLLADAYCSHTIKWANSLVEQNIEVEIFSLSTFRQDQYDKSIHILVVDFSKTVKRKRDGNIAKIIYLVTLNKLKRKITQFKPDILHAHSASSYGLLGALTGFHPYFISTWGSDVYLFPKKSFIHKWILRFTLFKADAIFATSNSMAAESLFYTKKNINVINFGVDPEVFKPTLDFEDKKDMVLTIGTVKSLDYNYGIEYLIEAFSRLNKKFPQKSLRLLLVGTGSMENKLKKLAEKLGIANYTIFTGWIPFTEIHNYHKIIDISVFPSISESFGVSVLEASCCEKPVIVSNVGGLPEVVINNETGIIFESGNIDELTDKIEFLLLNPDISTRMGKAGREFVIKNYNWNKNVLEMISFYKECTCHS